LQTVLQQSDRTHDRIGLLSSQVQSPEPIGFRSVRAPPAL
jgi:hypothetical protein